MKFCRWVGSFLVILGLTVVVGPKLSVFAAPQEKGKDAKQEGKKDAKEPAKASQEKKTESPPSTSGGWTWQGFDPKVNPEYYQTLNTETNQTLKVMGMDVKQEQKQTFYIKWIPQPQDKSGNWVVKEKIVGVKMDIDIGGTKISYDSTAAGQPQNPMTDFFKGLLELDLTFTIDKTMKVVKIEGQDEFVKKLSKTNPQMEPLLRSILSEEALKQMTEPTLFAFPQQGAKSWKKESNLALGPIGTYKTDYTFTLAGKEQGMDKVDIKANLAYSKPNEKGKLPFVIEDGELTGKNGSGYALFNSAKGRFDSYKMTMKLEGNLKIDIGGMKTNVELMQDQTATVTTSDTNPSVAAAPKKK